MSMHTDAPLHGPAANGGRASGKGAISIERSRQGLADRTLRARAVEAVIWGMPVVNFDLMRQAMIRAGGADNQIVYWSQPLSWKNQTLTPNPDTIYFMPFYNTAAAGPMVLEIPPAEGGSITGSIDDCWQGALEDVGPAGVDQGKGGKYLILPPGYVGETPPGYIALASSNYQGFVILRSNLKSENEADVARAVAYGKQVKLYPLAAAADPPPTVLIDAFDTLFDATIPYDLRFFQALDRMIQTEPWLDRDRAMIDTLKSIGIEKGKPFSADARMQKILGAAALEARGWLTENYEGVFANPLNKGARWAMPASQPLVEALTTQYANRDSYPVDARGLAYSYAYFSAKHLGAGQYYLMTINDAEGAPMHGDSFYRLHVPPNPPVKLYWSATAYDRATHALIRETARSSRASQSADLRPNDDGSVDVCFGPKAPLGWESNWVPTRVDGDFEVLFRFYGPTPALLDGTWVLPDILKMS